MNTTMPDLNVRVKDDEIIVTQSGSDFVAISERAEHEPELIAKGKLYGPREFLSRAWLAANDKARAEVAQLELEVEGGLVGVSSRP
jgi:hypothetical protein